MVLRNGHIANLSDALGKCNSAAGAGHLAPKSVMQLALSGAISAQSVHAGLFF